MVYSPTSAMINSSRMTKKGACAGFQIYTYDGRFIRPLALLLATLCCSVQVTKTQTVECQYNLTVPSDVVFIVDRSGSISDKEYQEVLDTVGAMISILFYIRPDSDSSRIALYTFGKNVTKHFDSISSPKEAYECELLGKNGVLDKMRNQNKTEDKSNSNERAVTDTGILFAAGQTNRPGVKQFLFLVTDAHEWNILNLKVKLFRKYTKYGVGYGSRLNATQLMMLVNCYHDRSEWNNLLSGLPFKDRPGSTQRKVSDPALCSSGTLVCTACTCEEFSVAPLVCTNTTAVLSTTSTTTTTFPPERPDDTPSPNSPGQPTREPPNPSPTSKESAESDDENEPLMSKWVMIILLAVVNFAFLTMWCAFIWMWCCGLLDKQFGTTPATAVQHKRVKQTGTRPETLGGNPLEASPPIDPHRPTAAQGQELYGNTLVDELLRANNSGTPATPSSNNNGVIRALKPPPGLPSDQHRMSSSELSEWSNPSYQGPDNEGGVDNQVYANTSHSIPHDYDNASDFSEGREDIYVNVKDRIAGKYRESKGRFSALIHSDRNYENEANINRYRAQYEERQNAPSASTSTDHSNALTPGNRGSGVGSFFAELSSKLNRGNKNKASSHDYLQPIP